MSFVDPGFYFPFGALLLGLLLGSFYNVCIHRYLHGESIVLPASRCPACGHVLSWWENIPVLSYLLLRARCRECREFISWRYPMVEIISGLWAAMLALKFGAGIHWVVYLVFGGLLIIMSFIDLDSFILPDLMTIPGGVAAMACSIFLLDLSWKSSVFGAIAGAGSFWILQKGYKIIKGTEGLGSGDIKLMFLLGALLGLKSLLLVILIGAISGLLISLMLMSKASHQGLQTAIPFGPFLSLGGMIYILCGEQIWRWYLG